MSDLTRFFGRVTGGRPAERLMASLGLPQSDDTILRSIKRHVGARDGAATGRVVGINDWAWPKGLRYGTIMVDLERREVIDVLSGRSGRTRHSGTGAASSSPDRTASRPHGHDNPLPGKPHRGGGKPATGPRDLSPARWRSRAEPRRAATSGVVRIWVTRAARLTAPGVMVAP